MSPNVCIASFKYPRCVEGARPGPGTLHFGAWSVPERLELGDAHVEGLDARGRAVGVGPRVVVLLTGEVRTTRALVGQHLDAQVRGLGTRDVERLDDQFWCPRPRR